MNARMHAICSLSFTHTHARAPAPAPAPMWCRVRTNETGIHYLMSVLVCTYARLVVTAPTHQRTTAPTHHTGRQSQQQARGLAHQVSETQRRLCSSGNISAWCPLPRTTRIPSPARSPTMKSTLQTHSPGFHKRGSLVRTRSSHFRKRFLGQAIPLTRVRVMTSWCVTYTGHRPACIVQQYEQQQQQQQRR